VKTLPSLTRAIESEVYSTGREDTLRRLLEVSRCSGAWENNPVDPGVVSDAMAWHGGHLAEAFRRQSSSSSNVITPSKRINVNSLFWAWGQFIDHSLIHTRSEQMNCDNEPDSSTSCGSVPLYCGAGRVKTSRTRARIDINDVRHPLNSLSSFLDASTVYGGDSSYSYRLRMHDGTGKLRYSLRGHSMMLPLEQKTMNDSGSSGTASETVIAGDDRAGEHPLLTALHTIWLREHNYWCTRFSVEHPSWGEERLFQTARHMVMAEIQVITYREWLPLLLDSQDLLNRPACYWFPRQSAHIFNEFASAAFRFGHSMVTPVLDARQSSIAKATLSTSGLVASATELHSAEITEETLLERRPLEEVFFESNLTSGMLWRRGVSALVLGALLQSSHSRGPYMVDALRSFQTPGGIVDLAALNIVRGRDHNLPSFQSMYELVTGRQFTGCEQCLHENIAVCTSLRELYAHGNSLALLKTTEEATSIPTARSRNTDDASGSGAGELREFLYPIDLWVGILSEQPRTAHAFLGEVGSWIVSEQFSVVRNTDPYFYLWDELTEKWRSELHNTRLTHILQRTTELRNVFPMDRHSVFLVPVA